MSDTRSLVLEAIAAVAPEADLDRLDPTADLRDELDIDSMDFLGVLIGINERLGVEVAEPDYDQVRSLDALVAYVRRRQSGG